MEDSTRQPIKNLTVIIKPTLNCNASCVYCSAGSNADNTIKVMSVDTFRIFSEKLSDYCLIKKIDTVTMIWHGGEPTIMPLDFYRNARRIQDECFTGKGIYICNTMQSNLTTPEEKIRNIVEILGIKSIGSSYDPDGLRSLRSGDFNKNWFLNYTRLRRFILVGAIYVINRYTPGREERLLAHFANIGINSIRLNWMYKSEVNPESDKFTITPSEWGDSIRTFLKISNKYPVQITDFSDPRRSSPSCSFEGSRTCTEKFIGLSPDGGIYNCGRSIEAGLPFGNIHESSITEVFQKSEIKSLMKNRDDYLSNSDCKDCPYWRLCHGGCMVDAYLTSGTLMAKTGMCEGYKKLFEVLNV